jgi:hypothetical protein
VQRWTFITLWNRAVERRSTYTSAAAGSFGIATSTVSKSVRIGTNRQVQLAFRLVF